MLYEAIQIWKRSDERTAIRYQCLKNLATGQYSVQSADFFQLPLKPAQIHEFQVQFVELFCESDPSERAGAFDSVEQAIAAHERDFNET
jgi:hypothetical protein